MRVQLENDSLANNSTNVSKGKIYLHKNTRFIQFPDNFCKIVATKNVLIESIFSYLQANYTNYAWIWEGAILAG